MSNETGASAAAGSGPDTSRDHPLCVAAAQGNLDTVRELVEDADDELNVDAISAAGDHTLPRARRYRRHFLPNKHRVHY